MENTRCAAFKYYEYMPETVPLEFTDYDVVWFTSKLSGAAGVLGAEVIDLRNWLLNLGFSSEELSVIVANLTDWVANSYPPPGQPIMH